MLRSGHCTAGCQGIENGGSTTVDSGTHNQALNVQVLLQVLQRTNAGGIMSEVRRPDFTA